jgi:hypothetical protein
MSSHHLATMWETHLACRLLYWHQLRAWLEGASKLRLEYQRLTLRCGAANDRLKSLFSMYTSSQSALVIMLCSAWLGGIHVTHQ